MHKQSRRTFFKMAGSVAAGTALLGQLQPGQAFAGQELSLGMASYTFRKFSLEDCLAMTKRLGLKRIAFKSFHLPLDASDEEIRDTVQKVNDAGLTLYGGGVIYMKNEKQVHQAFHYAQTAGMELIIGVPNHELLDLVEQKAKETNIIVAIHNHGPGDKLYPSPASVYEKVKDRDAHMGLCMDIGHTQRIGLDPSEQFMKFKDRIYDLHLKDVTASTKAGKTVEIGRGVIDIPKFLKTLVNNKYAGTASLEFEKDADDPLAGAAESIGYLRGVLAAI